MCEVYVVSDNGTAIIPPVPPRLGLYPNWDRRDALNAICRLILEAAHLARLEPKIGTVPAELRSYWN